ncbi:hypothetical protein ALC57_10506 [Trachymyrmex cornetzi]|uniref:HTH CENPB-type domain-containing protein n=1 Tax=Trachymyrmex cornetzi TaxID=471704 RepID=A0A151J466_9HYME|nr:hypothetical protein ALC57_10506 [Trachymyrmex cornetzi]
MLYISKYILQNFKEVDDEKGIIHDMDLRRWALEDKAQIDLSSFKASATWILNFKRKLDVYRFRQWKNFVRTFSDRVILLNYEINLLLRNNIIKLQSLTHIQLSSPRFHNLFKYAWYKIGYIKERPPQFETLVDFNLKMSSCNVYCICKSDKHKNKVVYSARFAPYLERRLRETSQ